MINTTEIEQWLFANDWSQKTRRNALLTLRMLFAFAAARAYMVGNPGLGVDLPTVEIEQP